MLLFLCCLLSVLALVSPEISYTDENGSGTENVEVRISGGEKPIGRYNDLSHIAQLIINDEKICGGSVINEYYILTAAHCVDDATPDKILARAGSRYFGTGGETATIAEITIHPNYNSPEIDYDIAYLRTETPFSFNQMGHGNNFEPAELEFVVSELPRDITVFGFGGRENGEEYSNDLMAVNLTVIHFMQCQVMYPELSITKNMFCAENTRDGGQGTCKGDGGDPAVIPTSASTLIGISSFTRGCGIAMGPSVFTNLGAKEIRDFIMSGTTSVEENDDDDDL